MSKLEKWSNILRRISNIAMKHKVLVDIAQYKISDAANFRFNQSLSAISLSLIDFIRFVILKNVVIHFIINLKSATHCKYQIY